MFNYLIRVQLPDRPGALGAVASRIGSVGGDVVSIDILQRDHGIVVDELGVGLAGDNLIDLLRDEILEVDGVSIESVRPVDGAMPDRDTELLDVATELFKQTSPAGLLEHLTVRVRRSLAATFAAVLGHATPETWCSDGDAPDDDGSSSPPGPCRPRSPPPDWSRRHRPGRGPAWSGRPDPGGGSDRSGTAAPGAAVDLDHGRAGRLRLARCLRLSDATVLRLRPASIGRTARSQACGPARSRRSGAEGANAVVLGPQGGQLVEGAPHAFGQSGQGGGPDGRGLDRDGPDHRQAGLVGHQLEEEVHGRGPAVDPEHGRRPVPVAAMASTTSRTWKPMASIRARARWARPVPRLSPRMVPRAPGSQWGLPSPVKAGTTTTPSLDSTVRASGSMSPGLVDDAQAVAQPLHARPRDEHRTLEGIGDRRPAPAAGPPSAPMAIWPSVPRSQAKVVIRPSTGAGATGPAFMRTKLPVPMVTLVMPGSKQAWPKRAACWSPAIPLMGTPRSGESPPRADPPPGPTDHRTGAPRGGVRRDAEELAQFGRPPSLHDVEEHGPRGVGGVGGEHPAVHAAGEVPQHPRVDGAEGQAAAGATGRPRSSSHCILVAEKYGSRTRPVRSLTRGRWPASAMARQAAAVRRSCHTMARCSGSPVRRSQATTVSRWLVMPMARATRPAGRPAGRPPRPAWPGPAVQISVGVVLDPARPGVVLGELAGRPRRPPGPGRPPPGPGPRWCRHRRRW